MNVPETWGGRAERDISVLRRATSTVTLREARGLGTRRISNSHEGRFLRGVLSNFACCTYGRYLVKGCLGGLCEPSTLVNPGNRAVNNAPSNAWVFCANGRFRSKDSGL